MSSVIGSEKSNVVMLYKRALRASSVEMVTKLREQYGPKQLNYLSAFNDAELYIAHSKMEDSLQSSQGTESLMRTSLVNHVRDVERQKMLFNFISKKSSTFLRHQKAAAECTSPVTPHVERILAELIIKSRRYQQSVQFVDGTNIMEATVSSSIDPTVRRHVSLSSLENTPPSCCSYSNIGNGFP